MNKKSTIKVMNGNVKFEETGQEFKDASGVFVFYSLLLNSLTHAYTISGGAGLPDVSKQLTTYLKSGQWEISDKFVEVAQTKGVVADVSTCFSMNLIPTATGDAFNNLVVVHNDRAASDTADHLGTGFTGDEHLALNGEACRDII